MSNYHKHLNILLALTLIFAVGCQSQPKNRLYNNPVSTPRTIAIAPFMNQSGSEFLDPMAVTDEFYTELQQITGLTVVNNNLVLAAMSQLQLNSVNDPQDALALADHLEVDAIVVGAITLYDPYPPPKVGMTVQLYTRDHPDDTANGSNHVNPGTLIRQPTSFEIAPGLDIKPRIGITKIIDADQQDVVDSIKRYAAGRTGHDRPHSWRYYTTQRPYLRFVSHEVIGELLARERDWLKAKQQGDS